MATRAVRFDIFARDRASGTFDRVGRRMGALEKAGVRVGAALRRGLAVGTMAVAGLSAVSVKAAADFESSMTKISTQAGGSAKDVKVLSDQVLKLGGKAQQAPQELADSLYHLKSVGMDNVEAMKALKEASDLAAVGGAHLEETTNALAGAWRTGIKGATSFHEAVSTVNAIIGAGNMRMEDFNAAIGTGILPSAKEFGLSLKQVGAALALMTDEGIAADAAATRLRMSFSLLGAPSGAAEDQLKKIHLTGLQLADAMRGPDGLIGAIQLLKDHLDASGLSASKQSQILSRAFGGGRSSSGILLMINNLDVLKKKQDQVNRSTGRFDDAVKRQRETAVAQWNILKSSLDTLEVKLGAKLLPVLTGFTQYINGTALPAAAKFGKSLLGMLPVDKLKAELKDVQGLVADFFNGLMGSPAPKLPTPKLPTPMLKAPQAPKLLRPQTPMLPTPMLKAPQAPKLLAPQTPKRLARTESDAQKFGETVRAVGVRLAKDLKPLAEAALGIATAFATVAMKTPAPVFTTIVDVMIATAITKRIIGLAAAFKGLAVGMSESWAAATGPVGLVAAGVWALAFAFSAASGRGTSLGATFGFLKDAIVGPYGIVGAVKAIGDAFVWVFSPNGGLAKHIDAFNKWLSDHVVGGFVSGVVGAWNATGHWFTTTLPNTLYRWFVEGFQIHSPSRLMMPIGANVIRGLLAGALGVAKSIGDWLLNHVKAPTLGAFTGSGGWLRGKGSGIISGLIGGLGSVARSLGGWLGAHVKAPVMGVFRNSGSWLPGKGSALVSGLKSGVLGGMKGIGGWIKGNVVDPVVGAVKRFFGIKSPSRVFMSIGGHLVSGLLKGMAKANGTTIAKKVFGSMPKALASIAKKGLVSIASLPGKALKALAGLGSDLLSALGLGGGGGGSVNRWAPAVSSVLSMLGAPAYALGAVLKRIEIESGGNPNAINLWDSNAKAGHPSQGLMQTIPSTFAAYAGPFRNRGILDPIASIYAGVNYAMHRYGANWISVMTRPGGYAKGTRGAAPGWAWVGERGPELVNFGGGEDVLSHPQSMAVAKANGIRLPGYASGTILNAADRVRRDKEKVEDAKDAVARAKRRHKGVAAAEKRLQAAEKELQAAEIALKNAKRSAKTSISNTIATGLLKKLQTGTSSAIASAVKSITTKLLNAGFDKLAKSVMKSGAKLEKLADKRAAIEKTIAAAKQYAADQSSNIKDFLGISGTTATSVGGLISQMTGQQKTAGDFVKEVASLKSRGASKELLAQLSEAGPGSQLAAILGDKHVTTTQIQKLNQLVASGGKLSDSFGKSMADMMYDSGKDAGKGFLSGLKSQEKELQKEINKLADGLVKGIKKALKIKSPSGVFRDEVGKQVALGMVVGMDRHRPHIAAAAQRMAHTARAAAVLPSSAASRATTAQDALWKRVAEALEERTRQPHQLTGQLVLDSGELLGVVRGTVKPMIKASEDRQAYRAKVGRRGG